MIGRLLLIETQLSLVTSIRHDLDLQLTCYKESDKSEQVEWPIDATASINDHLFPLLKVRSRSPGRVEDLLSVGL